MQQPAVTRVVDYFTMRQEIIDKGIIYIPPHRVGLLEPCLAAGCKFLTPRDNYGWVWRLEDYEMFDPQKSEQFAWAAVFRSRLLGRFGWLWRLWYRLLVKRNHFTWWLYRGRSI